MQFLKDVAATTQNAHVILALSFFNNELLFFCFTECDDFIETIFMVSAHIQKICVEPSVARELRDSPGSVKHIPHAYPVSLFDIIYALSVGFRPLTFFSNDLTGQNFC